MAPPVRSKLISRVCVRLGFLQKSQAAQAFALATEISKMIFAIRNKLGAGKLHSRQINHTGSVIYIARRSLAPLLAQRYGLR